MNRLNPKYNNYFHLKLRTVNHDILAKEIAEIKDDKEKEMFIRGFITSEVYNKSPKLVDSDGNFFNIMGSIIEPYELEDYTWGLRYKSSKRDVLDNVKPD